MIAEEVTEENIKKLLDKLPENLIVIEKLILCNEGTNQTLLSVLFGIPIRVEVISQVEFHGVIIRWVRLVAEYAPDNKVTVCLAESAIYTELNGFKNGIREKHFGIGQLISALKLDTKRELLGLYSDENVFSRTYRLSTENGSLNAIITEVFPKQPFKNASLMG